MRSIVTLTFVLLGISAARPMTFNIETSDLRPIAGVTHFIYGDGQIVEGDTRRLLELIKTKRRHSEEEIYLTLNSPGGSLAEGLRLGQAISNLKANTDVGRQNSRPPSLPGECLSACVVAYLGGAYRYLKKESKFGVHRFAFTKGHSIEAGTAVAVAQILSAEIVKFIKDSRADTDFFTLMSKAPAEDIYYVPHQQLRELRVVTDNIWDEKWSFEIVQGAPYLRIWQQSDHGENKLIVYCENRRLMGAAFVQPPANNAVDVFRHTVGIFIDGDLRTIPDGLVVSKPKVQQSFASAAFVISADLARQMLAAKSIGAAMQPPNKAIFFGFQTDRQKDRDMLSKMVRGCY